LTLQRALVLTFAASVSAGCAALAPAQHASSDATIIDVPFYAQDDRQCGPAALAMALAWSGVATNPQSIATSTFSPQRGGTLQTDLITATRRQGRIAYPIKGRDELFAEIEAGHPVVVLQNLSFPSFPRWHYAVVIGYDDASRVVTLHSGRTKGLRVSEKTFLSTWERAGAWGLVALSPSQLPARPDEKRWLEAAVGLEQAGKNVEALAAYRLAALRWPESLGARVGWSNAAYALGDLNEAEFALRSALRCNPNVAVVWNNLAHVLGRLGRKKEAARAAREALALGGLHADTFRATLAEIESR
jgi:hypothetical protein